MNATSLWMFFCVLMMLVYCVPGYIGAAKKDREDQENEKKKH